MCIYFLCVGYKNFLSVRGVVESEGEEESFRNKPWSTYVINRIRHTTFSDIINNLKIKHIDS